jgi:hypothetical protein
MHDCVRPMIGKRVLDLLAIRQFAFKEMRPGINGGPMASAQIIENDNFVPLVQQELGANAPDIAGATNDKDFHWREKCSVIIGKSKPTRQMRVAFRARLLVASC